MVYNKLLQASIDKYKAEISEALATLDVYFTNPVAIGEHPDLLTEIDKYIDDKLSMSLGSGLVSLLDLTNTYNHQYNF